MSEELEELQGMLPKLKRFTYYRAREVGRALELIATSLGSVGGGAGGEGLSEITQNEATGGISTTLRAITGRRLKQAFDSFISGVTSFAAATHDHDSDYAALSHAHDSDYAALSHDHDSDYAPIDGGKIPAQYIPSIAITEYLGSAANQTAMLALVGQKGDWCVRSDLGSVWTITGDDPTQLAGWTQLSYPALTQAQAVALMEAAPETFRTAMGALAADHASVTNERVPTAAGLTSKFATNKATLADGDKIAGLNSEADGAPMHVLWSLVKSSLGSVFAGLTGGKIAASVLPAPTTDALGGVKRNAGSSGQFVSGIDESGNLVHGTPAGGGAGLRVSRVTSQFANSTVALADVTGLSFAVEANKKYDATFEILWSSAASATGIVLSLSGPGSPVVVAYWVTIGMQSLTAIRTSYNRTDALSNWAGADAFGEELFTDSGPNDNGGSAAAVPLTLTIYLETGSESGTVQFRAASEVASSEIRIRAGSKVKYCEVP